MTGSQASARHCVHGSAVQCARRQPRHTLTTHAKARVRQRGFREDDIDIIIRYGTAGAAGRYVLTNRDADEAACDGLRRDRADRLRNTAVVLAEDGSVVTILHLRHVATRRNRLKRRQGRAKR